MDELKKRLEEIAKRKADLKKQIEESKGEEDVDLTAARKEIEDLEAEEKKINEQADEEMKKAQAEAEQRKKEAEELEKKKAQGKKMEMKKGEKMDNKITRNSKEYIDVFARYLKGEEKAIDEFVETKGEELDEELRAALLTTNATGGTIAIPDLVYDIVKTAWDKNDIMSLVRTVELKGNLKVNFEISGDDAVIHTEGSGAVSEEALTEGIVELVPSFIKKWKSISDEVYSLRGEEFVRYIYDEITYRIFKKAADQLIAIIAALPQTATASSPAAALISAAPAQDTVAQGIANLSDEAAKPVIVMNKLTYAAFKAVQYAGNYGVDVFEGLDVHFNNSLPSYAAADEGDVYMIVGDFDNGALANFPNGRDNVEFVFDTLSRKKEDLIEILGKMYVGLGVVANKSFTLIAKPETPTPGLEVE